MRVWQYWEGPMPDYIALCLETVRRQHPDAVVLDPAAFGALWQQDRDLQIHHIGPHYRSDFIRAYLLRHHGGLWLDADFVALRPLDDLADLPPEITFAGYRVDGAHLANGLMYSRPGDPVITELYERVTLILRGGGPIHWGQLGWECLAPAAANHPGRVHAIDHLDVSPIAWYEASRLEAPGDAAWLVDEPRHGVMLANSSASAQLRYASRAELLAGDSMLSDLLRRALGPTPTRQPT